MKKFLFTSLFLLMILVIVLLVMPSPIDPVAWTPKIDEGFSGQFSANDKLDKLQMLIKSDCVGCEDVAIDDKGQYIYGGEIDGDIMRFDMTTKEGKVVVNTGGRPLGLHFDKEGSLIIADAMKGLLSLNTADGELTLLSSSYDEKPLNFVDDLDIDSSGIIYFSDASSKFGYNQSIEDLMERRPHGALYSFNPRDRSTTLLLDDLYFANGVAVSEDQNFLMFNETGNYSVTKYWLRGPRKGQTEQLHDNLPGYPDGISTGADGIYWMTLVSPRLQSVEDMMPSPAVRSLVMKLPEFMKPAPVHYACLLGIDANGDVKYNFQSPNPAFVEITSVQQFANKIYFGSLTDTGIGFLEL